MMSGELIPLGSDVKCADTKDLDNFWLLDSSWIGRELRRRERLGG